MQKKYSKTDLIISILFLVGVFSCYQGAIRGVPWLGLAVVMAIIVRHLMISRYRKIELLIILTTFVIGFTSESLMNLLGIYEIKQFTRWLLPAPLCSEWLLALWVNFGVMLFRYLPMAKGKIYLPAILGIIFSTVIYHNAQRMGLISIHHFFVIMISWAILIPIVYKIAGLIVMRFKSEITPVIGTQTVNGLVKD